MKKIKVEESLNFRKSISSSPIKYLAQRISSHAQLKTPKLEKTLLAPEINNMSYLLELYENKLLIKTSANNSLTNIKQNDIKLGTNKNAE